MADPTIIDAGTRIDGRIAGDADVTVRGRVDGEIELSEALTVAEGGLVTGRINVREVIVEGAVDGDIAAGERIFLTATARVVGTLEAPAIQMADGAQFAGEVLMELEGVPAAAGTRTRPAAATTTTGATTTRATSSATTRPAAGTTTRPYEANATRPVETSASTTTTTVVEEEAEEEPEPAAEAGAESSEAEEPAITEMSKPELEDYTVKELREELRERDLQVSGTKDELIERLQQAGD